MAEEKRFITIDKVFSESFSLYFKNIIKLFIPPLAVFSLIGLFFYRFILNMTFFTSSGDVSPGELFTFLSVSLMVSLIFYILIYVEILQISNAYTDKEDDYGQMIKESLKRFFPFLWLHILFTLAIWCAMIFLIIPAFILMFGWAVFQIVFVVERKKVLSSLKRSWDLTKGNKGRIFLIYLLTLSAMYFFMFVFAFIFGGLTSVYGNLMLSADSGIIGLIVMLILYSFLIPLFMTFLTVIYYNLRKEKEGFETEILAESFMKEDLVDNDH
jgi:hypothetical protein